MKLKNLMALSALTVAPMIMTSCVYTGGTVPPTYTGSAHSYKVNSFVGLLEDTYWDESYFSVVKTPTEIEFPLDGEVGQDGFVLVYNNEGGFVAYDILAYEPGDSWSSYSSNTDVAPVYVDYDFSSYGEDFYTGSAYDNYTGSYLGEYTFEEADQGTKDLEKIVAMKEAVKIDKIGKALSNEYGLSAERGKQVAQLAMNWKSLSKSRAMTDADANAFSKQVLGVNVSTANSALQGKIQGKNSGFDDLVKKAADANQTSPEHMSGLLGKLLAQ